MNRKTVLITWCSSGLGVHIADKFEKEGHNIIRHKGKKHFDISNIEEIKKGLSNHFWNEKEIITLSKLLKNCKNQCYKCHKCDEVFGTGEIESCLVI